MDELGLNTFFHNLGVISDRVHIVIVAIAVCLTVLIIFFASRRRQAASPPQTTEREASIESALQSVHDVLHEPLHQPSKHPPTPHSPPAPSDTELQDLRKTVARLEDEVRQLRLDRERQMLPVASASPMPITPAPPTPPTPAAYAPSRFPTLVMWLGLFGIVVSVAYWAMFYGARISQQSPYSPTQFHLGDALPCLFYLDSECGGVILRGRFTGQIPYEPYMLWLSVALAIVGFMFTRMRRTT